MRVDTAFIADIHPKTELEALCGRERSGSPQPKSRSALCEGSLCQPDLRLEWLGCDTQTRTEVDGGEKCLKKICSISNGSQRQSLRLNLRLMQLSANQTAITRAAS